MTISTASANELDRLILFMGEFGSSSAAMVISLVSMPLSRLNSAIRRACLADSPE